MLLIAEFAYNNAKNASTSHISFELNCGYHSRVSFEKNVNPQVKSYSANKLADMLRQLIEICCQNLLFAWELQKKTYNKRVKSCSYVHGEKIWLNSKYLKTKWNKKLEKIFFGHF